MDTEDQVLRGTKLITDMKKKRLKIDSKKFRPLKIQYKNRKKNQKFKKYVWNLF